MLFSFIAVLGILLILCFNLQSADVSAQMFMNYASFINPSSGIIYTFPEIGDYYAVLMGKSLSSLSSNLNVGYNFMPFDDLNGMYGKYHYSIEPWFDSRHVGQIFDSSNIYNIWGRNSNFGIPYTSLQPTTLQQWEQQPWSRSISLQQDINIWDFYRSGYRSQMLINTY